MKFSSASPRWTSTCPQWTWAQVCEVQHQLLFESEESHTYAVKRKVEDPPQVEEKYFLNNLEVFGLDRGRGGGILQHWLTHTGATFLPHRAKFFQSNPHSKGIEQETLTISKDTLIPKYLRIATVKRAHHLNCTQQGRDKLSINNHKRKSLNMNFANKIPEQILGSM